MNRPERPENQSESLPFIALVPNLVTMLGLCAGLTAIRFVMAGRFELAVALILFSAVIDGFDGLIARRLQATSDMGAQLDSLSDFLNFGVAPGLLVYQFALAESERAGGWIFVLAYVSCACMRLARFNVAQNLAATNGEKPPAHFTGVPAPAGALLALLPVFISFETSFHASAAPFATGFYLAFVGLLMASRLPTFSPKSLRVPREKALWLYVAVPLVAGALFTRFWLSLIAICAVYGVSLLHSAVRYLLARRG